MSRPSLPRPRAKRTLTVQVIPERDNIFHARTSISERGTKNHGDRAMGAPQSTFPVMGSCRQ